MHLAYEVIGKFLDTLKTNVMNKKSWLFILLICANSLFAQTENDNLNAQLAEMKKFFLAEDYERFAKYTYPKVVEMMGGTSNVAEATQQSMNQMKNDGFSFIDLNFKDPSTFLRNGDELQCSITQVIVMDTPQGMVEAEYTLIGISLDEGKNWAFIDSSGKDKATMLRYFPNLHKDLVIKPKKQRQIGDNTQISSPIGEEENHSDSIVIDSNDNNSVSGEQDLERNETDKSSAAYKQGELMGTISAMLTTLLVLVGLPLLIVYLFRKRKKRKSINQASAGSEAKSVFKSAKTNKKERFAAEERLKVIASEEAERLKKRKKKEDPSRFMPK